jgi:DNA-directed RNA polymerase subunit RPC12/RpoP
MKANCPECKNNIDLARYPSIKEGMVIECNHCGITLLVKKIENDTLQTEIIDEGK